MTLDPAELAAAAAAAGPPPGCACPCTSYGHPLCDRPAEVLDNAPTAFDSPGGDPQPVCRQCAQARAALTEPGGATITIRFLASRDEGFADGALAHLVGKDINLLVGPSRKITGTVRTADAIEDGRAAQIVIDAARLIEHLFPDPAPEAPMSRDTPTPADEALRALSALNSLVRQADVHLDQDPAPSVETLKLVAMTLAVLDQNVRDLHDTLGRKIRAVSTRNLVATSGEPEDRRGEANFGANTARQHLHEAHLKMTYCADRLGQLSRPS